MAQADGDLAYEVDLHHQTDGWHFTVFCQPAGKHRQRYELPGGAGLAATELEATQQAQRLVDAHKAEQAAGAETKKTVPLS